MWTTSSSPQASGSTFTSCSPSWHIPFTVLLERLFQFKVLEDRYRATAKFDFMKRFRLVKADFKYINITRSSAFIKELSDKLELLLENCYLTQKQVKGIQDCKL